MPIKGEGIEIAVKNLKGFSGRLLTLPDDVQSVTVQVFNSDYSQSLLGPVDLLYVEEDAAFVYVWITTTDLPTTMRTKTKVVTTDGVPSEKFGKLRLKTNPHP